MGYVYTGLKSLSAYFSLSFYILTPAVKTVKTCRFQPPCWEVTVGWMCVLVSPAGAGLGRRGGVSAKLLSPVLQ